MNNAVDPERVRRKGWEHLYATQLEPYTYSGRAAEVLRHEYVQSTVRSLAPRHRHILDIGCSVGQLTSRLVGLAQRVQAMDLSPTAVRRARERCEAASAAHPEGRETRFRYCVGSALEAPFSEGTFDLVLMCDGLHSWRLTSDEQQRALEQTSRLLVPGGQAVITDHLKPRHFDGFIEMVRRGPLEIVTVRYLHNRLWFSFERGVWRFREWGAVRALLASRALARGLIALSSLAGPRGAKHLCVIARKPPRGEAAR